MLKQERWSNPLTHQDRVEVSIVKEKGQVIDFSVQYLAQIKGKWHPIVRFDTAHGSPHIDISQPNGSKQTRYIRGLDNKEALTYALGIISQRWESYRKDYEKGVKQ
jgi:phosphoribosylformylglycinamidine (FGAM) synthase-like amidotransferase family enzyme